MKKILLILLSLTLFSLPVSAKTERGGWYVMRNGEHKAPTAPAEFSYIGDFCGYYIGNTEEKVIYLTFDAGYENGNVAKVLDALKEVGAVGTFFVVGHTVNDFPELVKRMVNEGHAVANHTVNHKNMTTLSDAGFTSEIKNLEIMYKEVTGKEMDKFYRPPCGNISERDLKLASSLGYKTVLWSFAYADWDNKRQPNPTSAKQKILDNIHPGEIMLLHPTSSTNAAILADTLRAIKAEGYTFKTLNEL